MGELGETLSGIISSLFLFILFPYNETLSLNTPSNSMSVLDAAAINRDRIFWRDDFVQHNNAQILLSWVAVIKWCTETYHI